MTVLADYEGGASQVQLKKGDAVRLISVRSADWVSVYTSKKMFGLAPRSYLKVITMEASTNFKAVKPNQVSLTAGQSVTLAGRSDAGGWLCVELPSGPSKTFIKYD